ncbi:MAG: hypothetical protein ACRDG7_18865, partial [Candidatus Limnocylindria bacterium]
MASIQFGGDRRPPAATAAGCAARSGSRSGRRPGHDPDLRLGTQPAAADAALAGWAGYYNYHRLHGEIGWRTPAERYDGTAFTDGGFEFIPALEHL